MQKNKTKSPAAFDAAGSVASLDGTTPSLRRRYLSEQFPGRLQLIAGDSRATVSRYSTRDGAVGSFDLFHIDGTHRGARALCHSHGARAWGRGP